MLSSFKWVIIINQPPLTFPAYLPENKGMQTEWFPQDLNRGPLAQQLRHPVYQPACVAARAAILCQNICSLDDVIALS